MRLRCLVVIMFGVNSLFSQTWTAPGFFTDPVLALGTKGSDLYAGCSTSRPPQTTSKILYRYSNGTFAEESSCTNYAADAFIKTIKEYNGELYFGGSFITLFGPNPVYSLARESAGAWNSVGAGFGAMDFVFSLEVYNNKLYAAGSFTSAGGVTTNGIAVWDGSVWSQVGGAGLGANGVALCMQVYKNELYVAGSFTSVGGVPVNNIARWNGSLWFPGGTGMEGTVPNVTSLEVYNNELYAAGHFSLAGGDTAYGIARWNGSIWKEAGAGTFTQNINDLEVYQGELYATGNFTTIGGVVANRIARWNGASWSAPGSGLAGSQPNSAGSALFARSDGLYVGGLFDQAGGVSVANIARWQAPPAATDETEFTREFSLYPKPASGEIYVDHSFTTSPLLSIYDLTGGLLWSDQLPSDKRINIGFLSPGTYIIRCEHSAQKFLVIE